VIVQRDDRNCESWTLTGVTVLAAWVAAGRGRLDAGVAALVTVAGAKMSACLLSRGLAASIL
jgi:hypothetical protein